MHPTIHYATLCLLHLLLQAGIASPEYPDQLLIALEPEAASIYVRRLRMHQLVPEKPERRPLSPRKDDSLQPMNMDLVQDELRDGMFGNSFEMVLGDGI